MMRINATAKMNQDDKNQILALMHTISNCMKEANMCIEEIKALLMKSSTEANQK